MYLLFTTNVCKKKGLYAFHTETGPAYQMVENTFFEHEKCNLMELDFLGVIEPWLPVRKYSPYKEMIKVK